MKQRCYNKNNRIYHHYGGRGITVCKRWHKFLNFETDMFHKYEKGLSIERIDNNKGYNLKNCKWATRKEQNNNRRDTIRISYKGKKCTIKEISNITGLSYRNVYDRKKNRWTDREITEIPKSINKL